MAISAPPRSPDAMRANGTSVNSTRSPYFLAISWAMPYSKPPVSLSTVSPVQKPGAGRLVATLSTPFVPGVKPSESSPPPHAGAATIARAMQIVAKRYLRFTIEILRRGSLGALDHRDEEHLGHSVLP